MAELIINLMRQNGIREDVRSCNILISAYARANEPEKMMRTFRRMTHELQIPPESLTYEMLILGHLRGGNLRYAIDMYFAMRERDLYGHSVVHNQLLSALVASGQAQQTLQLWRDLSRSDRVLDDQSFGIMLDACDRFGLLEERHQIEQDRLRWKARTTRVVVEKEEGREEEDVIGLAQRYRHHRKQHQPSSSQSGGASNPWSA
ncbi:hypothetical protein BGZ73_006243 [Actinomortierella ambigua]|nr:hypothetical protein BGZ73_006243 [Actinomortierella ambigua]